MNPPPTGAEPQPDSLSAWLAYAGIPADDAQVQCLDRYREALWSWNQHLNLTRHTTLEKFVTRDVLDSYQLAKLLDQGEHVLDVGTGGGVPGLVIAILRPDLKTSVCESTQKKAKVVESIVRDLSLDTPVFATRAEEVLEITTFDTLVARGVAPLRKILTWLEPYWDAFEQLLLIKGRSWADERGEARHHGLLRNLELRKIVSYQTPGTGAESVILSIRRRTKAD